MRLKKYVDLVMNEETKNPDAQKYYEIVFMQGEEAEEPLKILENKGESKAIDYLSDWDYGKEMEHTEIDKPWGDDDDIYEQDEYVLSYNKNLGYIGLVRKVEKDNEKDKEEDEEEIKKEGVELGVPEKHQKKIALSTLKLSKPGARIFGGMDHNTAVSFLRKIGYSDAKIKKLLSDSGHSETDIKEFMGE